MCEVVVHIFLSVPGKRRRLDGHAENRVPAQNEDGDTRGNGLLSRQTAGLDAVWCHVTGNLGREQLDKGCMGRERQGKGRGRVWGRQRAFRHKGQHTSLGGELVHVSGCRQKDPPPTSHAQPGSVFSLSARALAVLPLHYSDIWNHANMDGDGLCGAGILPGH